MKGDFEVQLRSQRKILRIEWALGVLVLYLLIQLYYPGSKPSPETIDRDKKIFTCHAPQPSLLTRHQIDRTAFDADIKWVRKLLEGVVKGNNGYGQAANSVTLSIFLPNGDAIFEEGFGALKANESESLAPDGDSIYRMASITKMFTAAQLILQQQRNQIDFDQEVSEILPDFRPSFHGWSQPIEPRRITTRQLLTHTSGLFRNEEPSDIPWPDYPGNSTSSKPLKSPTRAELMASIRSIPAVVGISTTPVYSNTGFTVAGFVAEKIGKMNYTQLLKHDIFDPLGMASASFAFSPDQRDRIVVPAEPDSEWADWDSNATNPSGGLYCSAADLRRFGQELLQSSAGEIGTAEKRFSVFETITTREWLRAVHVFDDNLMSVGLPWEIFTVPVGDRRMSLYSKGGTIPSFHTLFGVDPEREFGYSLLISGEPSSNTELGIRIMRRFAETLDKERLKILKREFVGTYGSGSNVIEIKTFDGGLAITRAVVEGFDMFKHLHLGAGDGDIVALWPTGEPSVWRAAIGRPPAQPYLGCMHKFASIDPANSNGSPVDLMMIENGRLYYGAVNQTFVLQK